MTFSKKFHYQLDIATRIPLDLKIFIEDNFKHMVEPVIIHTDPNYMDNDGTHFRAYVTFKKHVTKTIYNSLIWTIGEYWGMHKNKNGIFD